MNLTFLFNRRFWLPGWGEISLSALVLALISGFMLIPLVPAGNTGFLALSQLIGSSSGHLLHSVHSYSGDLFLLTLFMHIWEYLYKKVHLSYTLNSWGWLIVLIVFSLLVVFSGFLSIGSKESNSAMLIFKGILKSFSFAGEAVNHFLFGSAQGTIVYLHHASTFTVLTVILTYILIRRIKPDRYVRLYSLLLLLFAAVVNPVMIGHPVDSVTEVVKGPWYFIGLQEMLSWLPIWLAGILFPLASLLIVYFLPLKERIAKILLIVLAIFILFYLAETIIAIYFRGNEWQLLWR